MDPNAFMMGGGMQMQQRPPPNAEQDQLLGRIVQELSKTPMPAGWQSTLELRTRGLCIVNLVKALRLLNNSSDLMSAVAMAMRFENQFLMSSPSEEQWMAGIKAKLAEITQAARQRNMHQQQQNAQMSIPMQPNRSHQGEMSSQVPMPPQMMGQMNMQQNMPQQMPQNTQFTPEEQKQITMVARQMMSGVSKDQIDMLRQRLFSTMTPQQREMLQRQNQDPVVRHFQTLAIKKYQAEKMKRQQQTGVPNIDFSSFVGQQADAMKMADQGQLVVPASNNGMGMDPAAANVANMGQMNMQPGMANQQQIQNMMAQRQQQTQNQMRNNQLQQQQAHAQAQARNAAQQQAAQQQMLRGQPGGLNTTQPPQQSPAMSMLNRPMAPPGQPSQTPPQPRPQPTPQPNQQMNPQLMAQFGQQIANNQNLFPPHKTGLQFPAELNVPPALKAKLEGMPMEQQRIILERLRQTQQGQAGQQAVMGGLGGAQMGQQNLPNGMGMPPQAPMNPQQMAMGMQGLNQQQIQQRLLMQRQREMDSKEFPHKILGEICTTPPNIKTWGQLKEFIHNNQQSLPQDLPDKVRRLQQIIIQKQTAAQANTRGMPGQQMPGQPQVGSGPNHPIMPTGAPPAPMVPQPPMNSNPGMVNPNMSQNTPNMNNLPIPPVTEQDMQTFRNKFTQSQNWPTEQIRQAIIKIKQSQMQRNPAMAAQAANAMRQAQIQQQTVMQGLPPQNAMAPQVPQMGTQAPPMQARPSQQFNGMPQNMSLDQKGQKRPGASDDVVEIPNPNQSPQRPATTSGQPPKKPMMPLNPEQLRNMHPDKVKNMPPEQRAAIQQAMQQMQQRMQMDALRRAQSQTNNPQAPNGQQGPQMQQPQQAPQPQQEQAQAQNGQRPAKSAQQNLAMNLKVQQQKARLVAIIQETEASYRKGPPQPVTEASMEEAMNKLRICRELVQKLDKMLPHAMAFANENIIRQICLERTKFFGEMTPEGMINNYISLSMQQLNEIETKFRNFMMQCINHLSKMKSSLSPEQPSSAAQVKQPPTSLAATAMARSGSKGGDRSKPPPAPTSAVPPPFPVSHPSPHGVPVYDGSIQGLTPDKLHLPTNKRRKTGQPGSSASTPANQGATPGSMPSPNIKMQSPEDKRRQIQPKVEPPRGPERQYKCGDEYCHFHIVGFEKEEEYEAHVKEAHKKVENPLDFFIENAAAAFDVDVDGNEKASAIDEGAAKVAPAVAKPTALGPSTIKKEALKAEGQTPGKSAKAATPSPFIKPGTPPTVARTPQGIKRTAQDDGAAPGSPKKKIMLETMAEKAGVTLPKSDNTTGQEEVRKRSSASPNVADGKDLDEMFINSIRESLDGLDEPANFSDMDWAIDPSPGMTPSSSNSGTSAATSNLTDISEHDRLKIMFECDPFGLGSGVKFDLGDDLGMGVMGIQSTFENKKDGQDNKTTPPPDLEWDTLFGPNAGLDKDESNWDKDAYGNSIFEGVSFYDV